MFQSKYLLNFGSSENDMFIKIKNDSLQWVIRLNFFSDQWFDFCCILIEDLLLTE